MPGLKNKPDSPRKECEDRCEAERLISLGYALAFTINSLHFDLNKEPDSADMVSWDFNFDQLEDLTYRPKIRPPQLDNIRYKINLRTGKQELRDIESIKRSPKGFCLDVVFGDALASPETTVSLSQREISEGVLSSAKGKEQEDILAKPKFTLFFSEKESSWYLFAVDVKNNQVKYKLSEDSRFEKVRKLLSVSAIKKLQADANRDPYIDLQEQIIRHVAPVLDYPFKEETHTVKRSCTMLSSQGRMELFGTQANDGLGFVVDARLANLKDEKYVFSEDACTFAKFWLNQHDTFKQSKFKSKFINDLRLAINEPGILEQIYNEVLAGVNLKSIKGVLLQPSDMAEFNKRGDAYYKACFNAIHKKQYFRERFGVELSIMIFPKDGDYYEYALADQNKDLDEFLKSNPNNNFVAKLKSQQSFISNASLLPGLGRLEIAEYDRIYANLVSMVEAIDRRVWKLEGGSLVNTGNLTEEDGDEKARKLKELQDQKKIITIAMSQIDKKQHPDRYLRRAESFLRNEPVSSESSPEASAPNSATPSPSSSPPTKRRDSFAGEKKSQKSHQQITDVLLPGRSDEVIDVLNDIMDDGMWVYFASGQIAYWVYEMRQGVLSSGFMNGFSAGWNYFDALGGVVAGIQGLRDASNATNRKREKYALAINDLTMSFQVTVTTTLTLLAQQSVLTGSLAAASLPLGGLGFALCMFSALAVSVKNLTRAWHKTDPYNLLQDRLQKYKNATKVLDNAELSAEEKSSLLKKQTRYKNQVLALARTYRGVMEKDPTSELQGASILGSQEVIGNPSAFEKKVANYLIQKQYDKVYEEGMSTSSWFIASVGMTLIALSAFFPPLFVPGLAFASVAAAMKVYEIGKKRLKGRRAKKENIQNVKMQSATINETDMVKEFARNHNKSVSPEAINKALSNGDKATTRLRKIVRKAYYRDRVVSDQLKAGDKNLSEWLTDNDKAKLLGKNGLFKECQEHSGEKQSNDKVCSAIPA